jgi:hypothetical protein
MREAIGRAYDYLVRLSDPGSGRLAWQAPTRPFGSDGPDATAAGMRALAHYAALMQQEEPDRAQRAYRRALSAESWLLDNSPESYPVTLRAAVSYDLYRYSDDDRLLDRTLDAVRELVDGYDLRTLERESDDTLPHFEAMYRMWRDLPTHPERDFWVSEAERIAGQYRQMVETNPFQLVPSGVTNAGAGVTPESQWDELATIPMLGDGADQIVRVDWYIARALDALYLADMSGDEELEKAAAAHIYWITGLNPGAPVSRVPVFETGSPIEAASLLTGTAARSVQGWSEWQWPRTGPIASITHGFRSGFVLDDTFQVSDTSLRHDGVFLYAVTAFEDYFNPGSRAPAPEPAADTVGAHVVGFEVRREGGDYVGAAAIAMPGGTPLADALVTVSFYGPPLADESPDAAAVTGQCVTDAAGACTVRIAAADVVSRGPMSAAVTNVEHDVFAYAIGLDTGDKIRELP